MVLGIFLLTQSAHASFFDDMMNIKIVNTVDELPFSTAWPDIVWQGSGIITGWVDIVGYRNLSQEAGKTYTFGTPASEAIVQTGYKINYADNCKYARCSTIKIETSTTTDQSDDKVQAHFHITLKYVEIYCTKDGCQDHHYTKYADFYDTETAPVQFTLPGNQSVILKKYNGGVYHPNVLSFDVSPAITQIHVRTENGTINHYLKAGYVYYTNKNVPYINLTDIDKWERYGGGKISTQNDEVVTEENITEVFFMTPYGRVGANITEQEMKETQVHPGIWGVIFVVVVGLWYIRYLVKRRT